MRLSRLAGLVSTEKKASTVPELFAAVQQIGIGSGRGLGSSGTFDVSLTGINTGKPFYSLYTAGNSIELAKIVGTTKTTIFSQGTRKVTVSSSAVTSAAGYGGIIALFRFPFKQASVDALLATISASVIGYRFTTSSSLLSVSTSNLTKTAAALQIASLVGGNVDLPDNRGLSISSGEVIPNLPNLPAALYSTYQQMTFLCKRTSTATALSDDGTNTVSVPIGGIYQLTWS